MAKISDYLKSGALYPLPHHLISRQIFWLTRLKTPLKNPVARLFIKAFGINMQEALVEDVADYATFNDFFTRALKPSARPIATGANIITSPADGKVSASGRIVRGQLLQAKNHRYSLVELLGGDSVLAEQFMEGSFATIYLSPRDYHRLHMPLPGTLASMTHIGGRLFSVAQHTVSTVPKIFARNERVVCVFDTPMGKMALILVGAINVAAIETVWAGLITPPKGKGVYHVAYNTPLNLAQGAEMGRFNMGSTVIVLGQKNIRWHDDFVTGKPVKMGSAIGNFD